MRREIVQRLRHQLPGKHAGWHRERVERGGGRHRRQDYFNLLEKPRRQRFRHHRRLNRHVLIPHPLPVYIEKSFMEPITLSYIFNGVLGVLAYFMKQAHAALKEDNKSLWVEVSNIKEKYFKKEDFLEFKQELWKRFDRLEDDLKANAGERKA